MKRLIFNLILIVVLFILAYLTYPSELARFFLLAAGIGIFITAGKAFPMK
ncbi:hypothetical protein [Bacillus sp. AK031]